MYNATYMNEEKQYLSKEKFQELSDELETLKSERRREIAEKLEFAKSLGDLSENAEYQEARQEQATIEDRILNLETLLSNAEIIPEGSKKTDKVRVGSRVTVSRDGKKTEYSIVGPEEVDIAEGKISNKSPIGEALMGAAKGDVVTYTTPHGEASVKIIDIA